MKKLGFGFMRLPLTDENNQGSIDTQLTLKMVDEFIKNKFTYFDTAYPYHEGMSEVVIRKMVVERYPRDAFLLADKMPLWLVKSSSDYQKFFDEQLEKCGVTYFDYYLLHSITKSNYKDTENLGGFEFVTKLKNEGKAKNIGFSFHDTAEVLDKILTEHPEMEFVQLQINYIDWESVIESRKCYETAVKHGKPVIVMEPVKGGSLANIPKEAEKLLTDFHPELGSASWALRFAASLENVVMVLSGMSNMEQMLDNICTMKSFRPLSGSESEILEMVTGIINESLAVSCTACRYCVNECPQSIPIPEYFYLYNDQHRFGFSMHYIRNYLSYADGHGKASVCLGCKQCEEHCPQHIEISNEMKKVSSVFDVS